MAPQSKDKERYQTLTIDIMFDGGTVLQGKAWALSARLAETLRDTRKGIDHLEVTSISAKHLKYIIQGNPKDAPKVWSIAARLVETLQANPPGVASYKATYSTQLGSTTSHSGNLPPDLAKKAPAKKPAPKKPAAKKPAAKKPAAKK